MKPAGYEACYAELMSAKLEKPIVYSSFTVFFDSLRLGDIRDKYGNDLYRQCMSDIKSKCCANCKHEKTCGYSPLATIGERNDHSYHICPLGKKSDGTDFYEKRANEI